MKQETESANLPPGKNRNSNTSGGQSKVAVAARAKSDEVTINFHSAEFNRIDDLNDCAGNYRSFQTLDGVVTAHERHQIEIRSKREGLDPPRNGPTCPRKSEVKNEDAEASEVADSLAVVSEGRTLIIDTDAERATACGKNLRNHRLPCTLLITGSTSPNASASKSSRVRLLHADSVSVTGAFGGFSAKVTVGGSEKPLANWFDDATVFDLVLDLQPVASFAGGRLPIGYYAPGPNPTALNEALAELPEMRGQFKKPQFVAFYKSRCFHGRSHAHDCRRCLEICPAGAIRSKDRRILINHYLCQGCGGCALVCPADAFRVVQPSQKELLNSLQSSLESRSAGGISPMSLVISDLALAANNRSPGTDEPDRDHTIFFEVGQIAYARLEVLLAALAYGARDVLVGCDSQNPQAIGEAVEWQVKMARAILQGLGLEEERIRFVIMSPKDIDLTRAVSQPASVSRRANSSPTAPTIFSSGRDGRALVHLAAQYLYEQSGVQRPWLPLPMGSPFGTVVVNSDACTLCMACVAACPSGALSSGGNTSRLIFQEYQCHQCGLCREKCPEGAIQLVPRLLLGGTTESRSVLRETEPFRCVECGIPFAPPAMIDRMREKLAGHWMYASQRQLRRLQMCRTCRTRDALTSGETGS
jgi:ferredoxin